MQLDIHSKNQSRLQEISLKFIGLPEFNINMLREDELHKVVSGNKYRKLKYNLIEAKEAGFRSLLSFGGAHSNHILALAAAGKEFGFDTISVIRGDELKDSSLWGPTLKRAASYNMQFHFVSREVYRKKESPQFLKKLHASYPSSFFIPEGGSNKAAIKGCAEILDERTNKFDTIAVSVGTGGTLVGLTQAKGPNQRLIGFSVLKGCFQEEWISQFASVEQFELTDSYCFGGYAKIDSELIRFINDFYQHTGVPLDPVYTGKMMYGLIDMLKHGKLNKNNRILAIHTGGLQGVDAMNAQLKKKNLPQICF